MTQQMPLQIHGRDVTIPSPHPVSRGVARGASAKNKFCDWFAWSSAYVKATGITARPSPYHLRWKQRTLFWRERAVFASPDPDCLLAAAEWHIMSDWADRLSNDCLVCHAAVLERNGGALLLVGNGGAGKSTLALALVRRGFRFLGDEFGIIRPETLEALPFPKALCIKSSGSTIIPSPDSDFDVIAYPPDFSMRYRNALCCLPRKDIVPRAGQRFPVRWVISLRGESAFGPPVAVSRWQAIRLLYRSLWKIGEDQFRAAAALARQTAFWEMGRNDLGEMADWIQDLVEGNGSEAVSETIA